MSSKSSSFISSAYTVLSVLRNPFKPFINNYWIVIIIKQEKRAKINS